MNESYDVNSSEAMMALGAKMARYWHIGDVIGLYGPLGAGKTTWMRGLLRQLGVSEPVRSPTYNLLQVFETDPPVLHADLFRVNSVEGIGIEDYLETHVCFIEWPDRAEPWLPSSRYWRLEIEFTPEGRCVRLAGPDSG